MSDHQDESKKIIDVLLQQQEVLLSTIKDIKEELETVKKNQSVIYGRMLITRKNMLEIYAGEYPSMTENEEKELAAGTHPTLINIEKRKKNAH